MAKIDKEEITAAYDDVRDDKTGTHWLVLKYNEEGNIVLAGKGTDFDEFRSQFVDNERTYGFLRQYTGDELSKRAKFVFITWIGAGVSPLKRAKTGSEKAMVKEVIKSFAVECMFGEENAETFTEAHIKELLVKAGGANYGTGER